MPPEAVPLAAAIDPYAAVIPAHGIAPVQPGSVGHDRLVYAIGEIGYDFGTEARMDYFAQQMGGIGKVHDRKAMVA